jgi:hypothetical protein
VLATYANRIEEMYAGGGVEVQPARLVHT